MRKVGIARKIKDAYQQAEQGTVLSATDLKALALEYLPIVKNELLRIKMRIPSHVDLDDLHGVAIGGMMRALEKWTVSSEKTFGAYLRQRVRGSMLDELRRLDVFSRLARKKAKNYDATVQLLEQQLNRPASEDEIRGALGLDPNEFNQLLEELRPISFLSLDAPLSQDPSASVLADVVDDPVQDSARDTAEFRDAARLVRERLNILPKKQQKILHLYYFKGLRLTEIASIFEITESRVSQLHTQAIRSLHLSLKQEIIC
jgi:RNA polymerase sigma factor FliA